MNTCRACGGIGEVQDLEVRQHGRYRMQWAPCRACDGTGHDLHWTADDLAEAAAIGNTAMATMIRAYLAGNPPAALPVAA